MAQRTYARISDSLLDIFNATEIGTDTTLRDDKLSMSSKTPFADLEWPECHKTANAASETEYLDEDDDPVEQQQFHRISGILSQLIREASNAINSTPATLPAKHTVNAENTEDTPLAIKDSARKSQPHTDTDRSGTIIDKILSTYTTSTCLPGETSNDNDASQQHDHTDDSSPSSKESRRRSRLPRPKKLSVESLGQHYHDHQHQHHLHRNRALSNASSTISSATSIPNLDEDSSSLSPVTSSLTTPMSRTISPLFLEKELYPQQPHNHYQQHHNSNHNHSSSDYDAHVGSVENQRSRDNKAKHRSQTTDDSAFSLTDSFERLDYSLAKVDTLSRDLANYRRKHPRSNHFLHTSGATTVAAPVPPPASTFISSDNNIAANQHHQQPRKKDHSDGWAVLLMMLPLFYIPYLLVLALWEKWNLAASVATTTPLDLLLTTIAALMSDSNATIPRVLISSPTATQIIPLVIGLSVYTLFMVILHLLMASKSSSSAMLAK